MVEDVVKSVLLGLALDEVAFKSGFQDRGVVCDEVPVNGEWLRLLRFSCKEFDQMWIPAYDQLNYSYCSRLNEGTYRNVGGLRSGLARLWLADAGVKPGGVEESDIAIWSRQETR